MRPIRRPSPRRGPWALVLIGLVVSVPGALALAWVIRREREEQAARDAEAARLRALRAFQERTEREIAEIEAAQRVRDEEGRASTIRRAREYLARGDRFMAGLHAHAAETLGAVVPGDLQEVKREYESLGNR
jgi:predicted membrane-bound mannosyltransferase